MRLGLDAVAEQCHRSPDRQLAVELDRELPVGTPVTLLGHGVQAESHARAAGTIAYEFVTGINRSPERTRCALVDS